jgi:hypothetical protein
MAYHVGRIAGRQLGRDCRIVSLGIDGGPPRWEYPERFDVVDRAAMESAIGEEDVLIVNPTFSPQAFGPRLPGTKIMYVQGYTPYRVLDGFCDHYVCVSDFVRRYVEVTYGFAPPVIPPFVHLDRIPAAQPWRERPPGRVLVYGKDMFDVLLALFSTRLRALHPELDCELVPATAGSSEEWLRRYGEFRYFLTLSPAEGFGLAPLEAMASGCTVVGFDANGSTEYMRDGANCRAVRYPRIDEAVEALAAALADDDASERLAAAGREDALGFGYAAFEARWGAHLDAVLAR